MAINSRQTPSPAVMSIVVAVPFMTPRTVVTAMLIGLISTTNPIHFGIVDESTRILLANMRGYTNIMLDPDTVSGRLAKTPIIEKIQLTLKAKKMINKIASSVPLIPSSGRKPSSSPVPQATSKA